MGRWASVCSLVAGTVFAIGCGGGSTSTTQQLRILMASSDTPAVNILINGSQVAAALAFTNLTGYLPVKAAPQRVQIQRVSDSQTIFQQTITVPSGANQTLIFTAAASGQSILLTDGGTTTTTGFGNVRVVNASTNIVASDVYILNAGAGLAGAKPVVTNLAYGKATAYETQAIGNYQVFMTAPGTSNVYLSTGSLALTQSQYNTVVAVGSTSGAVNYLLLSDQ